MTDEFITIKEYAEIRGCSVSAVYKRLNGTLHPYLVINKGEKKLKRAVLEDENLQENSPKSDERQDFQPILPASTVEENPLNRLIERLQNEVERLQNEVERLQKDNERLNGVVESKDIQLTEINNKLLSLLEQQQELNKNNQILLLAEKNQKRNIFRKLFPRKE